ncbi:MAG: RNase adapter RapZ [Proteobacteria bacterium]|uniref:RNase adapter RapZ n=1 Tax=Rudaea sp. TaxID=2136325 RepID=UPI001D6746EA|nr:RNase adapter RapZ [Pseudomonadota bacterium]MBS0565945.1 RNase adapter RapZ [Pseudomonadota bacterium]
MSEKTASSATRLVVISGMSGAGKTIALRALEDLDYYCVDNLPAALMSAFVAAATIDTENPHQRLAVGIDVRNRSEDLQRVPAILAGLAQQGIEYELIFLDARDDVLFKRYSDTRRRHPLTGDGISLTDAIMLERKRLKPVSVIANRVVDTSELNVHQLRRLMATELGMVGGELSLLFESFAYKRGVPADADFVFDARCLPNPHWDARVRPLSGRDAAVKDWLAAKPEVMQYLDEVSAFLDTWLPRFEADNRSYVTICLGCTGGRHRSVYLAEKLAEHFRATREQVLTFHRELE